jgi:predicted permease
MDIWRQDLRYAARMLAKNPGFTTVAVLSLGLGIGATTAAFGVLNAVVLRPLAASEPHRLVTLQPERRGERWILFNPVFEELRRRQSTLSGMFAVSDDPFLKATFEDATAPTYVRGSLVSGSYFRVLGLRPALGRLLAERDDEIAGASDSTGCSAVVSHRFWVGRFQGDPAVVGRTLRVRDIDCTIVGVAPAAFESHQAGYAPDVWLPLRPLTAPRLLASHGMAFFSGVMGRLRPGVTLSQAEAELTALFRHVQAAEPPPAPRSGQSPVTPADLRMHVASGAQGLGGMRRQFGGPLTIIVGVVAVVLLIAALNVANLLLARGAAREAELATRAALGAGRGRLVRQLATEGSLLAALGGLLGVTLAWHATAALASLVSLGPVPVVLDTTPDHRVLAVAVATTTLAALLAGVFPALRLSGTSAPAGMTVARRVTPSRHEHRLTRALVAAQLSLSLVLVTTAGLLLRTMVRISGTDPGFRPEQVVVLDVRDEAPGSSFGTIDTVEQKASRAALYQSLDERLNALPGVQSASLSWLGLFGGSDLWLPLIDADQPDNRPLGRVDYVSARYFDTVGMQMLRGRSFNNGDREGSLRVAAVNEALARERFGEGEALGRRLALDYRGEEDRPFTVVGVVRNSKYNDLREDRARPMMWVPLAQAPYRMSSVALRVAPGMAPGVARQASAALTSTHPDLMVRRVTTLSAQVGQTTARERLLLGLAAGFGALALLLAAVGLYGTLAYAVTRRTREIGVRLALGAQPRTVVRLVLGEAWALVAGAFAAGVPLALAAGYAVRAFLFGVSPQDVATLGGACALLALAATVAAYVPARRAAGVDPMIALRYE